MTAKLETSPNKNNSKQQLPPNYNPLELEQQIRVFWRQNNTQQKLADYRLRHNKSVLGYVEGPPTLNGYPHVGHARGRTMKDLHYRFKTMQGYYIPFWAGWDTQGLPVELEVEKQLGVKNKRQLLEQIGADKFVQECKKAILKYHKEWVKADQTLGIFIDQTRAYWTYKDEYIEREWQILKHAWDQELLEEGHYVVAYCPGCQTSLSSAEVGYEGAYQTVEDPSLYFKFHKAGTENEHFLIWTTMPFTLITDTMLAVHPTAEYAKVHVDDETWILASQRIKPIMQELGITKYETTQTLTGKDLEGAHYDYPFKDLIPKQAELEKQNKIVHTVITEEFVDINTATGVVHQAPGNGEEDFQAAQKRHTPIYAPFDDEVKFTSEAGTYFQGKFARDTDEIVIDELKKRGLLVQAKTIKHEYPTCWRSHHKLVWLARKEYFLRTDKINIKILEAAEKVQYYYDPPKNRFISFLKEGKPWCISRERVWGAPLPIWKCQKCQTKTVIGSKQELLERGNQKPPADFELHKPWVDNITLTCEKCGGTMTREDYVLDAWHNSGAAPYARFADDEYEKFVPVDFLTEAVDQTRGWANTLLLEHVILTGKAEPPYKAFLFQGLTQDARGRKMSKSLGNVIEANKTLEKTSADVFRFYVLRKCPPTDANDFDPQELSRRPYQVLSTLYHLNMFFTQNAQYDHFDPKKHTLEQAEKRKRLKTTDMWLLSELQETIQLVTDSLEKCEFNCALAALENCVIEVISRLYVPMIRKELWTDDPQTLERRLAIYAVLWNVLRTATLLFNPVTPHLAEALYQNIHKPFDPQLAETINLEQWPTPNQQLRNIDLEKEFQTLFQTVSLGYSARQTARIKRRWPTNKMIIVSDEQTISRLTNVQDVLLELSNVKAIELETETPKNVKADMWQTASENNIQIFLDTRRDEQLLGEGLMRDVARRVQALRKELGYTPTDIMKQVKIAGIDTENTRLLQPYLKQMAELVRSENVSLTESKDEMAEWHECDLEDKKLLIAIIR